MFAHNERSFHRPNWAAGDCASINAAEYNSKWLIAEWLERWLDSFLIIAPALRALSSDSTVVKFAYYYFVFQDR